MDAPGDGGLPAQFRPANPRTNSSVVIAGTDHTSGTTASGWVWNNTTHTMYASYFNETNKTWTGP